MYSQLPAATSVGFGAGDDDPILLVKQIRDAMTARCGLSHSHTITLPDWLYEAVQADSRIVYWADLARGAELEAWSRCRDFEIRMDVYEADGGCGLFAAPKGLFDRLVEAGAA